MPITINGSGTITGLSAGGVDGTLLPGAIIYVAENTAPTGFLKANGAAVSRTTYSALFTEIGTTFGSGDGSTTFNLPDLRGEFLRGWDDSRGIDSSRTFGSAQADDMRAHEHESARGNVRNFTLGGIGAEDGYSRTVDQTTDSGPTGAETRPRNIALLACIKF